MKKVAFIYEGGFGSNNGSNHLIESIILKLSQEYEITLIQSLCSNAAREIPESLINQKIHCVSIHMPSVKKRNFVKRYLAGISLSRKVYKECKKREFDMFIIQSYPTVNYTISKINKFKKPIIFNIYDVFPGSAYELGIIKIPLLNMFFKSAQRKAYKLSTSIIVMSNDMKNKLIEEKVKPEKIFIVNSWSGTDVKYVSDQNNSFVKEYNIDTKKYIVQFAGNIGQVFALKEFAMVVNSLKDNSNIEFHIIGEGVKLDELKKLTSSANIAFFPWQPSEKLSEVYSYCDIEIVPLHHGVIGNNVPSKPVLVMTCGKKVLNIVEDSAYSKMFEKNNVGWSFEQNQIPSIVNKIIELSNLGKSNYSPEATSFANSYYSKEQNLKKIIDVVSLVASRGDK